MERKMSRDMTYTLQFDKKYFPLPLIMVFVDGVTWELKSAFEYHRDNGEITRVPIGFLTDGATIPRIFWSWIGSPTGEYTPAAVVHDFCCKEYGSPYHKTDFIFRECMFVLGVPYLKRTIMYLAVRAFHFFQ